MSSFTMKREPLEREEREEMLEVLEGFGLDHKVTVRVLMFTGLRADELAHMKSEWVDWQEEAIQVPFHDDCACSNCRQKAEESEERTVDEYWRPKSDMGARRVPIRDVDTLRIIRDFFKHSDEYGVTRQTVRNRVHAVAEETDIMKRVMPHSLRHTYGTWLAEQEMSAQYIRQTMGHEKLETASEYIRYSGRQLDREADEKLGGIGGGD